MQLEGRYARLLGLHLSIERGATGVVGLKALVKDDGRIEAEKRKIKAEMDEIARQIKTQFYPSWEPALVRPVTPRPHRRLSGVAIEAYRVLRLFRRTMTTPEIVREVCERLNLDYADERQRASVRINVTNSFNARVREGLISFEGSGWKVTRRSALAERPDSANRMPKPVAYEGPSPASRES